MNESPCILINAIIKDDLPRIIRLFAKSNLRSSLLFCRDAKGNEPIHLASVRGSEDTVKLLVKLGSDPDVENEYGWTPLMLASYYGKSEVVRYLLSLKSVNPNKTNSFGLTALKFCVYGFHHDILLMLLDQNVDVNHSGANGLGMTALMIACQVKNQHAAKSLIFHGADCNYQSKSNGWSSLFYAIHPDDDSLIKILLSARAEPNLSDWNGRTAKTIAMEMGCNPESIFGDEFPNYEIDEFREINTREKSQDGDSSAVKF